MPVSLMNGKPEAMRWIWENTTLSTPVLDVGCGAGWWGVALRFQGYSNLTGLDVHNPYMQAFRLHMVYHNLIVADARKFPAWPQGLVILGDVLEHLSESDATELIARHRSPTTAVLCSVPWNHPQEAVDGVESERHLQPALTREKAESMWHPDTWLYDDQRIGVFVCGGK